MGPITEANGRQLRTPVLDEKQVPSVSQPSLPHDFAVKAGKDRRPPIARTLLFSRTFLARPGAHVLLAMQKGEGSNPFSRFEKDLHLQVFFVEALGWFVCVDG
jgi:hypothetical protein